GAGVRCRPGAQDRVGTAAARVGYIGVTDRDATAGVRGGGHAGSVGPGIGWAIERHAARTCDAGWVGVLNRNDLNARGAVGAGIRGRPGAQERVSAAAARVGYIGETNRDATAGVRGRGHAGGIGPGIRRAIERHAARTGDAGWV